MRLLQKPEHERRRGWTASDNLSAQMGTSLVWRGGKGAQTRTTGPEGSDNDEQKRLSQIEKGEERCAMLLEGAFSPGKKTELSSQDSYFFSLRQKERVRADFPRIKKASGNTTKGPLLTYFSLFSFESENF